MADIRIVRLREKNKAVVYPMSAVGRRWFRTNIKSDTFLFTVVTLDQVEGIQAVLEDSKLEVEIK